MCDSPPWLQWHWKDDGKTPSCSTPAVSQGSLRPSPLLAFLSFSPSSSSPPFLPSFSPFQRAWLRCGSFARDAVQSLSLSPSPSSLHLHKRICARPSLAPSSFLRHCQANLGVSGPAINNTLLHFSAFPRAPCLFLFFLGGSGVASEVVVKDFLRKVKWDLARGSQVRISCARKGFDAPAGKIPRHSGIPPPREIFKSK